MTLSMMMVVCCFQRRNLFTRLQTPAPVSKYLQTTVADDAANRAGRAAGRRSRAPSVRAGHRACVSFARVVGPLQSFVSAIPPAGDKAQGRPRPCSSLNFRLCPETCALILQIACFPNRPHNLLRRASHRIAVDEFQAGPGQRLPADNDVVAFQPDHQR